jgi:predicted kinase
MITTETPIVVIVFGLPGSGKSFFASALAEVLIAEYVNSDKLRKSLISNITYAAEEKRVVYHKMLSVVEELVNLKKSVVVDGTFYKKALRDMYLNSLNGKAEVVFIEVYAAEELIKKRLAISREYSDADYNVYKSIRDEWEPLTEPHLIIRSKDDNLSTMLHEGLNYCSHHDQLPNQ